MSGGLAIRAGEPEARKMDSVKEISAQACPAEKEMEREIRKQIEEIMDVLKCPKEFICYTSGFRNLCKAKDIGLESFVMCLMTPDSPACRFSVDFGGAFFCQCPLRVHICRKLKK
jgi:hypothetical protein